MEAVFEYRHMVSRLVRDDEPTRLLDITRASVIEERISSGLGQLELLRVQEVLLRHLPSPPARVLDVGSGLVSTRRGLLIVVTRCMSSTWHLVTLRWSGVSWAAFESGPR